MGNGRAPLFALGRIVMTQGVDALVQAGVIDPPLLYVLLHVVGDWSEMSFEDRRHNLQAVLDEDRIVSAFQVTDAVKIYVITEGDRSVTTLLLPSEY
ncbi:hypothetical protein LJR039_007123 [Pseudorhodoferax sp. LjRoot39]|uniref:hypothetical protein n=1 Tax=Pseudorhodoferax sp. LjRoot39 TaxID=3342328 RepID=UPI003ECC1F24